MTADSTGARHSGTGPVFVVGMNGSGTTMLLDSLGRHPDLYAFPHETRLIPHLVSRSERFGNLRDDGQFHRLWLHVLGLPVFVRANGGEAMSPPEDWRNVPRSVPAVIDRVFREFARREQKSRWCEKTPQHVQHICMLAGHFPDAKFVHVIRDGRDAAASFNRRWHRTPELTVFRWKKVVREGRRQGRSLDGPAYLEVRYEDLTTEPEHWLRKICEFLEIPFDDAVLVSSEPYLDGGSEAAGSGRLRANSGKWKEYFTTARLRSLERIGGATLATFGYETDAPQADSDPGRLTRRYWTLRDIAVQYGREIVLKLRGDIERPWSVILSKPVTAMKQRRENRY